MAETDEFVSSNNEGTSLYDSWTTGTLSKLDTATLGFAPVQGLLGTDSSPVTIAVSPDGAQVLVCASADNTVTFYNTTTMQPVTGAPLAIDGTPVSIAVSINNQAFAFGSGNLMLAGFNISPAVLPQATLVSGAAAGPSKVIVNPSGDTVFVVNTPSNAVYALTAAVPPAGIESVSVNNPTDIALSPDGSRLYVCSNDGTTATVAYYDLSASPWTAVAFPSMDPGYQYIALSADGNQLFVYNATTCSIATFDTGTLQLVGTPWQMDGAVSVQSNQVLAASPKGDQLALCMFEGSGVTILSPVFSGGTMPAA